MAENRQAANALRLVVLTPSKRLLDVVASAVYFPSAQGKLGILPGHAALVCQLGTGVLHYEHDNLVSFLSIAGGVGEVRDNVVTLLADVAEDSTVIDVSRAEKALQKARSVLAGGSEVSFADMDVAAQAEARAMARLEAATHASALHK